MRVLFLRILYACPAATAVTVLGTVGLPGVWTGKEWKEDFKNVISPLFLTLGSSLFCFSDQKKRTLLGELSVCANEYFLILSCFWIQDWWYQMGRINRPTENPLLIWYCFEFCSPSSIHLLPFTESSSMKSFQDVVVFSGRDWMLTLSCLEMEPLLFWKDIKCIVMFLCW